MRRDALQVGSLALVVVLAGCGIPFVGGQATPTATRVPLSPTESPTIDPAAPPGVSPAGIDSEALLSAHEDGLSTTTYTLSTFRGGNASSVTSYERTLVSPTAHLLFERQTVDGTVVDNSTAFINATAAYRRLSSDTRRYEINARTEPLDPRTGRYEIESFVAAANFSFASTGVRDGTPVVVYRVTGPDQFRSLESDRTLVDLNATLAVDAEGIVRYFAYNATVETPTVAETVTYRQRVSGVGTTSVSPPSWLQQPQYPDQTVNRTLTQEPTGATLTVAGDPELVESTVLVSSDAFFLDADPVQRASVSPFLEADSDIGPGNFSSLSFRMPYNESAVPDGDEAGLSLFVYDERVQTFVQMNSTVDAVNDTVTATAVADNVTFTIGSGANAETYRPELATLSGERVFVVMHAETWYDAFP
jgi:hypothetical protein